MQNLTTDFRRADWLAHAAFWLLLLTFHVSITSHVLAFGPALLLGSQIVTIMMIVAYVNVLLIIPAFFRPSRFVHYALAVIGLLVAVGITFYFTSGFILSPLMKTAVEIDLPLAERLEKEKLRIVPMVFMTIAILFISTVYTLGKEFLKRDRRNLAIQKARAYQELEFLRSQINPHFLFNALNNLGATIYLYPERAEGFIQKLGDMLRYMLESNRQKTVFLAEEIQYLENYLFFQRQRGEPEVANKISFKLNGQNAETLAVPPLLLITTVENAFVHGYPVDDPRHEVNIDLSWSARKLQLLVVNKLPVEEERELDRDRGGLGLANLHRRLSLLFPNSHEFTYGPNDDYFYSQLTIEFLPG